VADDGCYVLFVLIDHERDAIVGETLTPRTLPRVKDGAFEVACGVLTGGVRPGTHETPLCDKPNRSSIEIRPRKNSFSGGQHSDQVTDSKENENKREISLDPAFSMIWQE
jgi:hypothetical protein